MTKQIKLLALWTLTSIVFWSQAQASNENYSPPSYIMIETSQDDMGNKDSALNLDLTIFNNNRIMLYGRRSHMDDQSAQPNRTTSIGFSTDPSNTFNLELKHEESIQELASNTYSNSATANINLSNWILSVEMDTREIQFATSAAARRLRPNVTHITINGKGNSISLGYYGWEAGSASIFFKKNSYDRPLAQLQIAPLWIQRIFSQNSLNAAWGLNKSQKGFTLNRYFERAYISLAWTETVAAVDSSVYAYNSIRGGYDLTQQWSVELEMGTSSSSGYKTTKWTSAALAYRW